jgi:hypothetical protein
MRQDLPTMVEDGADFRDHAVKATKVLARPWCWPDDLRAGSQPAKTPARNACCGSLRKMLRNRKLPPN